MKIEHVVLAVKIVRRGTILDALHEISSGSVRLDVPKGFRCNDLLREPLWERYEGDWLYKRTLGLASLQEKMTRRDFYRKLGEDDYYPASFSEAMAYLLVLKERGVAVGNVLHLGTILRSEEYMEGRLLTKPSGAVEFVPFYPATRLGPSYSIVVVRAERRNAEWLKK
ncbi:MAG: hypothetical protein KGI71_01825 [Patescibacteria group bacterium]|nr:hypothetical protein [Patescibacteria group bacterium]